MKKIYFGLLLLIGVTLLVACANSNRVSKDLTEENQKTIAMQATTSLVMMNEITSANVKKSRTITDEEKTNIKGLLAQLDVILSNDNNFKTTVVESDLEEYSIKQTVSFIDESLTNKEYSLYYNETSVKENIDDYDDDDDDDDEDDDEYEVITEFKGIIVFEGVNYELSGRKEVETDGNEKEETIEFNFYYDLETYVKVNQEFEIEDNELEEEFEYRIYQNKKLIHQYKLEIEQEKNETEIELLLNQVYYEIDKYESEGKTYFSCKVRGNDEKYKILFEKVITSADETNYVQYIEVE